LGSLLLYGLFRGFDGPAVLARWSTAHLGQHYDALVTGQSDSGTWVRILTPPVEGRLESGAADDLQVGHSLRVELMSVNVERGFIDFARVD